MVAAQGQCARSLNSRALTRSYIPQPEHDVELVQFMGKDNVPFHTIIFPATLLGSDRDWLTLHRLSTTEYLNYEGGKVSRASAWKRNTLTAFFFCSLARVAIWAFSVPMP